jgi:copper chaperone
MYELNVLKMSCGGCVRSVTQAVQALDSAARVEVDLAGKKVRVATEMGLDAVKSAIINAGYPVTEASGS